MGEKARLAGIEYALETTGLYSMREEVEQRRFKDVVKPFFVENEYGLICISDLELEQTVYEAQNPEDWKKVYGFFSEQVNEIRKVAEESEEIKRSLPHLQRTAKTNTRWDEHREMFDEYTQPDLQVKL